MLPSPVAVYIPVVFTRLLSTPPVPFVRHTGTVTTDWRRRLRLAHGAPAAATHALGRPTRCRRCPTRRSTCTSPSPPQRPRGVGVDTAGAVATGPPPRPRRRVARAAGAQHAQGPRRAGATRPWRHLLQRPHLLHRPVPTQRRVVDTRAVTPRRSVDVAASAAVAPWRRHWRWPRRRVVGAVSSDTARVVAAGAVPTTARAAPTAAPGRWSWAP